MNLKDVDTRLYDAAQHWSDAQWARFLRCDKKEIPSIRRYMLGKDSRGRCKCLSGVFIEPHDSCYDWWFHFANFYCYSTQQPFASYDEALDFSKRYLIACNFNKFQQDLFDVPRYAAMMMKIHGER